MLTVIVSSPAIADSRYSLEVLPLADGISQLRVKWDGRRFEPWHGGVRVQSTGLLPREPLDLAWVGSDGREHEGQFHMQSLAAGRRLADARFEVDLNEHTVDVFMDETTDAHHHFWDRMFSREKASIKKDGPDPRAPGVARLQLFEAVVQ